MPEENNISEFEIIVRRAASMSDEMYEWYERTNPFFAKVIRFAKLWVELNEQRHCNVENAVSVPAPV